MSGAEARMSQEAAVPFPIPTNMVRMLLDRAAMNPDGASAQYKKDGVWRTCSWSELVERARLLSDGLVSMGVQPGARVAILSATRFEHPLADAGILSAGAIAVPIYHSILAHEVEYILEDCGAELVFVEDEAQLAKVRVSRERLPKLRKAILIQGEVAPADADWVIGFDELERKGEGADRAAFDARVEAIGAEDPASLLYTSGTTGKPKGVILTHRNWCYEAAAVSQISIFQPGDSILLFLPLAHSFGKVVQAVWWHLGAITAFAEGPDKIVENAGEVKPSIIPSAPRVFEKVFSAVVHNGTSSPGLKGALFRWAMGLFAEYVEAKEAGREYGSLSWTLAKKLVFSKVTKTLREERLGGRIRIFVSGGAPLSPKIAHFFDVLGLQVLEGYGLTETSAATTVNRPGRNKIGTVGPAVPGTEIRIAADGEVLIRGGGVMKGYYNRPEETAEVLQQDGWLHTGDIGSLDADGCLRITDRKKDIIVTAGGKNIAPQNLENALKINPLVSQVLVYGDKRKFLTALITVQDETGRKLLENKGIRVGSYEELTSHPEIYAAVERAVNDLNAGLPSYETIKRFAIPPEDFTIESGELTPTLKVKRKVATDRYRAILDAFYEEKFD